MAVFSARGQGELGERRRLTSLLGFGSAGAPGLGSMAGNPAGGAGRRSLLGGGVGASVPGWKPSAAAVPPVAAGAAATTAAEPEAPVTKPSSSAKAQEGNSIGGLLYTGKGSGANGIRKRLMQLNYKNAMDAQAPMWDAIQDLIRQSQTDRFSPEGRAQFLAPRMQAFDQMERQAQGAALRNQLGRGLDESSYGGAVAGTLGSQFGTARAGAINELYNAEEARQLQSQALLRDLLMGLQGRSSQQAASIADTITSFRLQQQQLEAMNNPWATLGGILGSGMGMAGQLGWNPLRPPTKPGQI